MNIKYKFKGTQTLRKENPLEMRKILVHPIISYIYSNYGFNPNPRRPHRRDASTSILYRLPSNITRYPDFKMTFYESMKMSFAQIKKMLESANTKTKTNCGKVLVNSLYFRCLDCEVQNESSLAAIYCADCFSNSKHEGHRIISKLSGENPVNCNCGDSTLIKEQSFCSNHGLVNEESIQDIIKAFPENLKENFCSVMANVFYALFNLCEEFIKRPIEERKDEASLNLDLLMEDIIAIVKELYKINSNFKLVISRFLMKTLESFPQSNMLSHNCRNLRKNEISSYLKVCECTYLAHIIRFHSLFSKELNMYLAGFLADLMLDAKFRGFFSDTFTRYVYYIFPIDITGNFECYGLEGLSTQAYTGESNCRIIIDNNIDKVIDLLEEMMDKIPARFEELNNQHISSLYGLMNFINYIPEKNEACKALLHETNVIERLVQIVCILQVKHLQYIIEYSPPFVLDGWNYNVAAFSRELELSAHLFRTTSIIFNSMSYKSLEMKKSILDAYKISMLHFLQQKEELKSERKKSIDYTGDTSITLHLMLQRVFVFLLGQHLSVNNQSISLKNINSFIDKTLEQSKRSIPRIASTMVKEGLKCIGALSYLTLATTIDNFSVSYYYFLPSSAFYYFDLFATQIFATFLPSNKIFKTFWKYFFVLDESTTSAFEQFFDNNWEMVDINDNRRIRAFLEFLAHFLTTELSLLNAFSSLSKVKAEKFNQSINSIHSKTLVLILQKFSNQFIDVQTIKACADLIMSDQLEHTDRLPEVCEIEKTTGKFKLKNELKQTRQSYYFPDPRVEKDVAQTFMENFPDKDILDSSNFNIDFDVLTVLREKFFEGELSHWLLRFFMNFKEEWIDFLPHVMKLTLIGLELIKNKTSNKKCEVNIKIDFIQNKELLIKLEEIEKNLTDRSIGSFTCTFKRIREVINQCNEASREENMKSEGEHNKEDEEAERKRKIKQRQLEIQKQFQMKQANFVQNMKPENQKAFIQELKKDEEAKKDQCEAHVCHFCRDVIDLDANDYGVPVYVGKCNINFSEKEIKSQDNMLENVYEAGSHFYHFQEFKNFNKERNGRSRSCFSPAKKLGNAKNNSMKIKYYPFITSCMHMAHIKCHDNYIRDIDDEEAYFFCAYCKSTYNCLLTKCAAKTIRDSRKATVKINDSQRVPLPFTKTFVKAAGVIPSPSGSITLSQLSNLIHLLLAGFLQVTKNKCLYELESFMAKRYFPYKLLFENMTRFMKDYSKCFKVDLGDTIFSLFYKSIYEPETNKEPSLTDLSTINSPPSKTPRTSRITITTPKSNSNLTDKKFKPVANHKQDFLSDAKSPIKSLKYQDKRLSSNTMMHQLQTARIKAVTTKSKLANALSKVNKKTIPDKKAEIQVEKELAPISLSLQSLEPSETEITSIKYRLSCLLIKEELEEALQREIIKAIKARLSDIEIKRILSYGVFLGNLQVLIKVLSLNKEEINIGGYRDIGDQILKSKLLYENFKNELIIFLERMLVLSFMAFNIKDSYSLTSRIQEIVSNASDDEKHIDILLKVFDPEIDLKSLLSDKILSKLKIEEGLIIAWQRILSETLASETAKEKAQSLNTLCNPQLVINLPDSYLEFNSQYISKKCDLCKSLSANNHSAICLQCGVLFCLSPCCSKSPYNDNLCNHANAEHKGECVALCIQTCEIILVCSKFKTFLKESLYADKFGQSPTELDIEFPYIDWNNINIKKGLRNQIVGWISNHKIVQQIGYEIQKYHMA